MRASGPRADLGFPIRLGRGAPAPDHSSAPCLPADHRLLRAAGRGRRVPGGQARRREEHRAGPEHAQPHLRLLFGPTGLAVRLLRARVIGWWVAIAVAALLFGLIAKSASTTISGLGRRGVLQLGATGTGADALLGVCFLILAVLVAFVAAGQITAARAEESAGMLDHMLTRPVSRTSWLEDGFFVALVILLLSGLGAGLFTWFGAASQHAGLSVTTLLGAGVNLVPPAIIVLGFGVLVFGVRPRPRRSSSMAYWAGRSSSSSSGASAPSTTGRWTPPSSTTWRRLQPCTRTGRRTEL